ncbi:uncharacterized protein LOC131153883 [Malania oleifera]|uniref:uncharacterized protein LOC131153883 n=1 Tax=Malania oleifera TaxID=397392 RepID=UPI0025ADA388|nr:uncharacterized protein LOC131153883 [Malania oleifera]
MASSATPSDTSCSPVNSIVDPSSNPYYFQSSDGPNLHLVNKVLTRDNFQIRSMCVTMALSAKNKLGFIYGTLEVPLSSDVNYATWKRGNDTVKSWILNLLSDNVYSNVMFIKSVRDIWIELEDRFSLTNGPRIF